MTTYTTIPNTDIDQDSPVTQPLMTALRDNPISIAECDASVDPLLLPSVLLGTLTTTSGTTHTLSSLTLTPYKFLVASLTGLSTLTSTSGALTFDGQVVSGTIVAGDSRFGQLMINLVNGDGSCTIGNAGSAGTAFGVNSSYTTASTSVTFALNGGGQFDAGSIRIYGVK